MHWKRNTDLGYALDPLRKHITRCPETLVVKQPGNLQKTRRGARRLVP